MRVLVAGVNQGLGLVLSRLIAEKGHTVYAGYRNKPSEDVLEAAERFSCFKMVELDLVNESMAAAVSQEIACKSGNLDAVIITAGVLANSDREFPVTDMVIADLRTALEVQVVGSAIMIKHFHRLVKEDGMFITVTSEAGSMTNTGVKYPGYSISKAAQNKLIAIFAKTVAHYSVYAVHPGRMNTAMGKNDAQIEPEESAEGIYRILSGEKKILPEKGWFIDYCGEAMEI
jgi:NAD(P)-dependent dehydrogenase (short-subunit alcohol dehydrogenase family)